jgi:hypothetical protein
MTQLVYNRFASRTECLEMSIVELVSFYEEMAAEAERERKEAERNRGR